MSHHASYRSAILSRSFGLTVRASPRTSSKMVVSRTPRARAIRAQLWPITGSVRGRGQDLQGVQPGPGRTASLVTDRTAAAVPRVVHRRRPEARSPTVAGAGRRRRRCRRRCRCLVPSGGCARERHRDRWPRAAGRLRLGLNRRGVYAHLSSPPRLGSRADQGGPRQFCERSPGSF